MRVDILTQSEQKALFAELKGEYRLIWTIGVKTGLRVSDVLNLSVQQLQKKRTSVKEIKTGKRRLISIPASVRREAFQLSKGKKGSDKLFTKNRIDVWFNFKRAAQRAGISKNIGSHTMRKSYARNFIDKGHTLQELQKQLNHSKIGDTIGYIIDNETLGVKK